MAIIKKNIVFFCVTDYCNAKCKSCSFWKTKKPTFPKKEELPMIVNALHSKLDCKFLQITGGETLTYPYISELVRLARKKGMITQLMTNGSLVSEDTIKKLCDAGLDILAISIDHHDDKVMEKYRGIPGLPAKIRKDIKKLKKTNLLVPAGICLSKYNIGALEKTAEHALLLGFDEVYFCWPIQSTESTYKLGNDEYDSANLSNEQIITAINTIIKLKKRFGYKISHTYEHLEDILRYYKSEKQKFPCKAGENLFYLDNHLDVYRCMTLPDKLGNILGDVEVIKNAHCEKCPLQCFREPSICYSGLKSVLTVAKLAFNRNYWKLIQKKCLRPR
ncbi:MAG: radical SAM protein [Candidatus Aenigmarchaeota archaeon]|nr:radical SAM protein [Candidatus Aenigmarchaeota archaeon]